MSKFEKRQALEELQRRQEKQIRKLEKQKYRDQQRVDAIAQHTAEIDKVAGSGILNCACVIHGNGYDWSYVEKLYNMIVRNCTKEVRFHVYTEHDRSVPPHMIKHNLQEWPGISGPRASWWYKMQLFNSDNFAGPLLYFDLDVVVVRNIDWVANMSTRYFWAIKDFRSLWRNSNTGLNSSIMWWDTRRFHKIWQEFSTKNLEQIRKKYHGDQDYITAEIPDKDRRTFEQKYIMSWRWQALDGGLNFGTRVYKEPGTGTTFGNETSVLVFHGTPKPHEVKDPEIVKHWI